jgi:hypothetical protein
LLRAILRTSCRCSCSTSSATAHPARSAFSSRFTASTDSNQTTHISVLVLASRISRHTYG